MEKQEQGPEGAGGVDRRGALRKLAALGGAAVVGAAVLRPDEAGAATGTMAYGTLNDSTENFTALRSVNTSYTFNVMNNSTSGEARGMIVQSATGEALLVRQNNGGATSNAVNIEKFTAGGAGISVQSSAIGIDSWVSSGSGSAVKARSTGTGTAMRASIENPASAAQAIRGDTNGTGYAIYGQTTGNRAAIGGSGGSTARGAVFISNIAQLRLQPSTLTTHPASGQAGDLFVDANKRLWFCRGGTAWKQLA